MDVFDALGEEYAAIDAMLGSLGAAAWDAASLCEGWTVADVVLHLAQTEEWVVSTTTVAAAGYGPAPGAGTVDDVADQRVAAERGMDHRELFDRWRAASASSLAALRGADPEARFAWATNPLKPRTLATTRLSEHWIHANDVALPLGVAFPDTDRIWHIARLAHRTIPYAYTRAGREDPPAVRVELVSPGGENWEFGAEGAGCVIRGAASDFCRIAARRLARGDATSISTEGDRAAEVLDLVRTYA